MAPERNHAGRDEALQAGGGWLRHDMVNHLKRVLALRAKEPLAYLV